MEELYQRQCGSRLNLAGDWQPVEIYIFPAVGLFDVNVCVCARMGTVRDCMFVRSCC